MNTYTPIRTIRLPARDHRAPYRFACYAVVFLCLLVTAVIVGNRLDGTHAAGVQSMQQITELNARIQNFSNALPPIQALRQVRGK